MQTKVIIGTISFMLTMIILGFATLLEPARLEETTLAYEGRQVEKGAALFQANCSNCHGIEGKAMECFDPASGEPIGCAGLPLNNPDLLCGEPSPRMTQLGWSGSKRNLILQTVSAGRPGTLMPTWSQEFGGSMEDYQIEQVTSFVLNWGSDELCGEGAEAPAEEVVWPEDVAELPEGDPASGENLYNVTFACASCHGDPTTEGSNAIGPWLGNIAVDGANRIEGVDAEHYIYESILNPNAFIAPVCVDGNPCVEPSAMQTQNFDQRMSLQDMADVIAYLLTLGN
jgi:mono/diheme cytochrome c family protein